MNLSAPLTASACIAAAFGIATFATSAQAQTPQCGSTYTVKSGDSLTKIASAVYGSASDFQIIYSANAAAIGSNPGLISVGLKLNLPCENEEVTESTADLAVITEIKTTESLPAPKTEVIRVVAGGNWAPFLTEDQEQGGMIAEITNVALANADGKPDYRIDFINDWGAHLQPLISDHRYDFSLAWFRPNCDIVDRLGDGSKFRCNNLKWSEPLFEQIFGYYTLVGKSSPESYGDMFGKTICRPAGYSTFMLEEHGLSEPNVTMARADSPQDCFAGLASGEYDVVAIAADNAEGVINSEGLADKVIFNEPLSQVLTLHAVTSKTHPNADANIKTLDSGLQEIKKNGEWFNIVRRHLSAYRAANRS